MLLKDQLSPVQQDWCRTEPVAPQPAPEKPRASLSRRALSFLFFKPFSFLFYVISCAAQLLGFAAILAIFYGLWLIIELHMEGSLNHYTDYVEPLKFMLSPLGFYLIYRITDPVSRFFQKFIV